MGKYSKYARPEYKRHSRLHPIWRGIGCLIGILIPIISYVSAVELVKYGTTHGWPIPSVLLGRIHFPNIIWRVDILAHIARPITTYNNLFAVLVFTLILMVLLFGIVTTVYSFVYRTFGAPRYSKIDSPPPKRVGKVRKSR